MEFYWLVFDRCHFQALQSGWKNEERLAVLLLAALFSQEATHPPRQAVLAILAGGHP